MPENEGRKGESQLYLGGDIHTMDPARPFVEAVAVRDGWIVAVGSKSECEAALDQDYHTVDLKGGALFPGFIDTHLHPVIMVYYDMNLNLRNVTSISDLQRSVSRAAEEAPADGWVVGLNLDEQNLEEKRLPTRHELDAASSRKPVVLIKHDGHTVIGNTLAIKAAGVTASTPDPVGGVIDREEDGAPLGIFRENASALLKDVIPLPDAHSFVQGAKKSFQRLLAKGIVSAGIILQTGEEGPAGAQGAFELPIMQMLLEQAPISLYSLLISADAETIHAARDTPLHQPEDPGGHRVGGMKLFADGTFGSCTAYMREPYSDHPESRGLLTTSPEELYKRMVSAHQAGLQIAIHAIGDAGNRLCVDLYERLLQEYPRDDHRHRIEHASQLDAAMIVDMSRLGLVANTTPLYIHSEKEWLERRLGSQRVSWTYPFRSLLYGGVVTAGSSDAPIESVDVLRAIQCCVTREGFQTHQGISAAEAVRMYTLNAAYAQFCDHVRGSISVGKRADLVILSASPLSVPPEEIGDIQVKRTIIGGKPLHDAG